MKIIDYSYQNSAANTVLENALDNRYLASILAACPGAGKTTISHIILNKYFRMFPNAKVLVLTEGQILLTSQYLSELEEANVDIEFTYGPIGSGKQVQVGIPQNIYRLKEEKIDLILIDEAHNYYLEPMVQKIVLKLKSKYKILMTGSPTKYNDHNKGARFDYFDSARNTYAIHYISAEELQKQGVFSGVNVDVTKVTDRKNALYTIKEVMTSAIRNSDDLSKIMIACPNIKYANIVANYLKEIGRNVSLSTSKNDKENIEIDRFKKDDTNTLIVVGRGILGFNDKMITFLIDLRSSNNLDSSYQLFARVLRVHPKGIRKTYTRVGDSSNYRKQTILLHKMIALMRKDIFESFTGNNIVMETA